MVAVNRENLRIFGIVQGVGFRPHVARCASLTGVTGLCGNDEHGVFVEAQGSVTALAEFSRRVVHEAPPLAHITEFRSTGMPVRDDETTFQIVASATNSAVGARSLLPADVATCADCLREFNDPHDRRYLYPFINCTNCGPRLSLIIDLPYDRERTTMREFPLCSACESEYHDPSNRRFHAEPTCCAVCGPRLEFVGSGSPGAGVSGDGSDAPLAADDPLAAVTAALRVIDAGGIVAIKGVGGFHLVCDATNIVAVARLRERKHRPAKPLAVMVADATAAAQHAALTPAHLTLLESPAAPIVLAPLQSTTLAPGITCGLDSVGLVLPYSALHHALFRGNPRRALVMTSGNQPGAPLCFTNASALTELAHVADAFLLHDRDIHVPVEDSVMLVHEGEITPSRRSRGYAPLPLMHGVEAPEVVLAVGGEVKNTFALTRHGMAFLSPHLGDMSSLASIDALGRAVTQMQLIHGARPQLIAHDLHPGYGSTRWAERYAERHDLPLLGVQHHHAHALALLAEHRMFHANASLPAQGVSVLACDGTGYGTDGTIWGGELLQVRPDGSFERLWHVPTFQLVGGDTAVRQPVKIALALAAAYNVTDAALERLVSARGDAAVGRLVASQLAAGFGGVPTSSLGRVFDAFAWLADCVDTVTYEGEAAVRFEVLARTYEPNTRELDEWLAPQDFHEFVRYAVHMLLHCDAAQRGRAAREIHARCAAALATAWREKSPVHSTILGVTGGVFMNRILSADLQRIAARDDIRLLSHTCVPPNDGGLALGQAVAGALSFTRFTATTEMEPSCA